MIFGTSCGGAGIAYRSAEWQMSRTDNGVDFARDVEEMVEANLKRGGKLNLGVKSWTRARQIMGITLPI